MRPDGAGETGVRRTRIWIEHPSTPQLTSGRGRGSRPRHRPAHEG